MMRKIIQGMSESSEHTNPTVPAVDGMTIRRPEMRPTVAVLFPNILFLITNPIKGNQ